VRKAVRCFLTSLLSLSAAPFLGRAVETTCDYSVQVSASVRNSPAEITLYWPPDASLQPQSYSIYRRKNGTRTWGRGELLPAAQMVWTDHDVRAGTGYEYQIVKQTPHYTAYGYIYAGIDLPLVEDRGHLLLVVDSTFAPALAIELTQLEQDLVGDGWAVTRLEVSRHDPVTKVKALIRRQYRADPNRVNCIFLLGHVPVPYSGDIVPDGHFPDHQGAWPCDGYYGDMEGVWTDRTVNQTRAADARNRNVPGDGKFDQSLFPAPIKLMVGRVDLANMPGRAAEGGAPTFPNELSLLRNYLNKDHRFRTKQFDLPRRAMVGDYFGIRDGEAFAASGWRNFAPFFGSTNITSLPKEGTWIPTLTATPCLWAYGCGNGTFNSIGGLGNGNSYHDGTTTQFVQGDLKAVFTLCFGSWLGDWDSEDDLLRSVLALPSYGLTSAWSGRPHWFVHHMALGETIGFSARLTQNNRRDGPYHNQLNPCAGQIHIALMGDPTLRMHVVAPPANLTACQEHPGVRLNWTASKDCVVGYHVYRAAGPKGPFKRLTPLPVSATSFLDEDASVVANYMVRAIKLETSASGTYYNPSQGVLPKAESGSAQLLSSAVSTRR
jgi:hypothetical protein